MDSVMVFIPVEVERDAVIDVFARAEEAGGWNWRENPESGFEVGR